MIVGYRRVSTKDQTLDRQMLGDDVERYFDETVSGKDAAKRLQLQELIRFVRAGDEVRVWSIDRLGRSLTDLDAIVRQITQKGASVRFLSEGLEFRNNETDPFKRMQFQLFGMFAEFERNMSEKRRLEGMHAARLRGRYEGAGKKRKEFSIDDAVRLHQEGLSYGEIAQRVGGSKASVYREIKRRLGTP